MDSRSDTPPEEPGTDGAPMPTQAELEAMFDADDADVAAGRIVPAEPVLAEMRATAARIRRERHAKDIGAPNKSAPADLDAFKPTSFELDVNLTSRQAEHSGDLGDAESKPRLGGV